MNVGMDALPWELVQYYMRLLGRTVCTWCVDQFHELWPNQSRTSCSRGGLVNHMHDRFLDCNKDAITFLGCISDSNLEQIYRFITRQEEMLIITIKRNTEDVVFDWKHLEWLAKVFFRRLHKWQTFPEFLQFWQALGKIPVKDAEPPKVLWQLYNRVGKDWTRFFLQLPEKCQRHFYAILMSNKEWER